MPKSPTESIAKSTNNVAIYVSSMVLLAALTMGGVLAIIFLRPAATDNASYIAAIIGVATPIIGVLMALLQRENHLTMNSRLDQLLMVSKATSRAEGVLEGAASTAAVTEVVPGKSTTTVTTTVKKDKP